MKPRKNKKTGATEARMIALSPARAAGAQTPFARGRPWNLWRSCARELPWVLVLCLATAVIWGCYADRLSLKNWSVPVQYSSDSLQILGWIQAAAEGDYRPFHSELIKRLGAPYEANWNDYPMYEKITSYLLGLLARWFGLMQASNAGILLSHVTSAMAFYLCCRWLKHRREWSFVGALLFAFTTYQTVRNLGHLLLAFTWTIPLAILSVWLVLFSRRMRPGDRASWFCLTTAVIMGLSNPYNLNMYGQLLVIALVVGWFINRRRENLKIGLYSLGLAALAFLAINFNTFAYQWAHGRNGEAVVRQYSEAELYALKPVDLFIPPPTHHLDLFSDLGFSYRASTSVPGEMFSPYLGVVGIAGLVWLGLAALVGILRVSRRNLPPHALQGLWIFFYATLGGLNCVIAFAGLQLFRAGNRFSIFISTLILLFLVSRLSLLSRRWPRPLGFALAAGLLALGLFDQVPRATTAEDTDKIRADVENDRAFGAAMEAHLPPGAMVFQLPVMVFPDAVPTYHLEGYAQLLPYFFTKTLHFAYGSNRGRPREAWQREIELLPPAQMIEALERFGFSAIYVHRNGYTNDAQQLLNGLADQLPGTDATRFITDGNHEQVCLFLTPSPHPVLPPDDEALVTFRRGWILAQEEKYLSQRWSSGNATLTFFNPAKTQTPYDFSCDLGSYAPRTVTIECEGREIWRGSVGTNKPVPVGVRILARPGNNFVRFRTPEPLVYPPNKPDYPMSIGVIGLEIRRVSPDR